MAATSALTTETITSMLQQMNSTQIISTLETLNASGFNVSSIDIPAVITSLNVTQVTGLLEANSTTVDGLLQSLQPIQLATIITEFQNTTSTIFKAAAATNNTALYAEGTTLVSLLMEKVDKVFTDSQLLGLFKVITNGAAFGTGAKVLLNKANDLIAGFFGGIKVSYAIPERLLLLVQDYQVGIFGGYPDNKDIAPSAIFLAIFAIFTMVYSWLFLKNSSRGHKFYVTLGLAFYSLCRTLGFILRLVWAKHPIKLQVGLASTIFVVICTVFLPSMNLILAQRYFTWKHPSYGSSKLFMSSMYIIYGLVVGVVLMTIIAACVQIDYLLSEHHYHMTKQVIQASSVLILFYSLISVVLVFGSFVIPSTSSDKQALIYQPTWVKSFGVTYFVPKGAAAEEESSVPEDKRHAIRVIQSTDYHYETVNDQKHHETKLHHNGSIIIISITTVLMFIGEIFRCVSTFIEQYNKDASWIFDPVVMYVLLGALETFVNLFYIFGRIDLRFYKPDAFKNGSAGPRAASDVENISPAASSEAASDEKDVDATSSSQN